jgi:DNA-binding transcriptional regulator YiaG
MSKATALVDMGIKHMGSLQALADAMQVNRTTVVRWDNGKSGLTGTALVALMALIRHPEDFERYKI